MKIHKCNRNNSKGITLIALVLTIILLLILAAITLVIVNNSALITRAENATKVYTYAEEKEKLNLKLVDLYIRKITNGDPITIADLQAAFGDNVRIVECDSEGNEITANINIIKKIATATTSDVQNIVTRKYVKIIFLNSGDWFVVNLSTGRITWTSREGATATENYGNKSPKQDITFEYKGVTLKVGDYVEYSPAGQRTSYVASYSENEEIEIEYEGTIKWRVLGLNENGKLELISETPTESTTTRKGKYFDNWETVTDAICENLYSNPSNGSVARNLKIEDIEKTMDLNYWDYHNFVDRQSGYKYGEIVNTGTEIVTVTYWSEQMTSEYFVNPIYFSLFCEINKMYALSSTCIGYSQDTTSPRRICGLPCYETCVYDSIHSCKNRYEYFN